ncbi:MULTISPECIES: GlxA family transcriptional regulator [Paraburkholderia]|uniref:Transcriptional regulator, AraC family n=1 Tax=Paraburkholderia megapolitana TaxID=420953 RepID=A0A1I3PVW0_9BURK|nr:MULTISPECIES: helix-turn-helix domain-containing protein [Paraburkholderia]MCX4162916.1 helix-turn-helix domain-containing protein [Paraburkholderia megapolitana]MDN7158412.1 helix-turn-helix domain-containing protein [Paraburkholderia sp. CHISQ3]MDQ6495459.1 helix-turn-helix domain-containing protein [Paraburkholderia megapolitana]QDQ81006.1 helix-turn-helix domain-containing protein [Paraburkholderia megapolitana]SFJ25341.1 transcriptional regulator, AraC family [Paraburkholderia megapoli
MRIYVLALEGVFDTGLTTVLDSLTMANNLANATGVTTAGFDITVTGMRPEVRTALGMQVPVHDVTHAPAPDWIVVPALNRMTADVLVPTLERNDVIDALGALRSWRAGGARVAAACTGTFVLAESGLLDGGEATTTWWLSPLFRQRYPHVNLDVHRIVVPSGAAVTAGAALSHLDLGLWLIRNNSPELASLVARYLVFDTRMSQSVYAISDHLSHSDPLVEQFDRWVREHLDATLVLDVVADGLGTSTRTLTRRLNAVLGKTPVEYIQDLRIERAVHLLKTTRLTVDRIAEQVGYADGSTLRTLLRRRTGKGVRELRGA